MLVIVAAFLVAGGITVSAGGVIGRLTHPRDVEAFQSYVVAYGPGGDSSADPGRVERNRAWIEANPDRILSAGVHACQWLEDQPSAPDVDESGARSTLAMAEKYLRTPDRPSIGLAGLGPQTLVHGAWGYLCWSTREDRTARTGYGDD